jgi:hypothetical protein
MHLRMILEELHLGVFQYNLGYQFCFMFTRVAPIYPTRDHRCLHTVLGFSVFFPHMITFSLVSLLVIVRSRSQGSCQRFFENVTSWAFPFVHHYLLIGGGSIPSPFGNHDGRC